MCSTFGMAALHDADVIAILSYRLRLQPETAAEFPLLFETARATAPPHASEAEQARVVLAALKTALLRRYLPPQYISLLNDQIEAIRQAESEPFETFLLRFQSLATLFLTQHAPEELRHDFRPATMSMSQSFLVRCFRKSLNTTCSRALTEAQDALIVQSVQDGRAVEHCTLNYRNAVQLLLLRASIRETGGCYPPLSARVFPTNLVTTAALTPPSDPSLAAAQPAPVFLAGGLSTMPAPSVPSTPAAAASASRGHPRGRSKDRNSHAGRASSGSHKGSQARSASVPSRPTTEAPQQDTKEHGVKEDTCYFCNKKGHRYPLCPRAASIPDNFEHPSFPGGPRKMFKNTHKYIDRERAKVGAQPLSRSGSTSRKVQKVMAVAPIHLAPSPLQGAAPIAKTAPAQQFAGKTAENELFVRQVALNLAEDSRLEPSPHQFGQLSPDTVRNAPLLVDATVDSGAAVSCIALSLVQRIAGVQRGTAQRFFASTSAHNSEPSGILAADGKVVPALGQLWLRVSTTVPMLSDRARVHPSSVCVRFLVFDDALLALPIILGLEWLRSANLYVGRGLLYDDMAAEAIAGDTRISAPCLVVTSAPATTSSSKRKHRLSTENADATIVHAEVTSPVTLSDGDTLWSSTSHRDVHSDLFNAVADNKLSATDADAVIALAENAAPFNSDTPSTPAVHSMSVPQFRDLLLTTAKKRGWGDGLSAEQMDELFHILVYCKDAFANSVSDLASPATFPPLTIAGVDLTSLPRRPVYTPKYTAEQQQAIFRQVQEWLACGIVERCQPGDVLILHNILCVRKRDGSYRLCIDPRALNARTAPDDGLIPLTSDVLEQLSGSCIFSTLDLASGYLQLAVEQESRKLLGFATKFGTFRFARLPFGLRNACSIFNGVLREAESLWDLGDCVASYFDDIAVFSSDFDRHLGHLYRTLHFCMAHNLKVSLNKCTFASPRIAILGHLVDAEGLHADPSKVAAITMMPRPRSRKQLQSFLGCVNYFRTFIPGFSMVVAPLFAMLKKDSLIHVEDKDWSPEANFALDAVKSLLAMAPCLALFDSSATTPLVIETDASEAGLGAILYQQISPSQQPSEHLELPSAMGDDDATVSFASLDLAYRVVAYNSRSLSKAERNYSVTELELLSIVFAVTRWRHYLCGRRVVVFTDHAALQYTLRARDLHGRLARWQLALCDLDITIVYRPGSQNAGADCLSRLPIADSQGPLDPLELDPPPQTQQEHPPPQVGPSPVLLGGFPSPPFHPRPAMVITRSKTRPATVLPSFPLHSPDSSPTPSPDIPIGVGEPAQARPTSPAPFDPPLASPRVSSPLPDHAPMEVDSDHPPAEEETVVTVASKLPRTDPYAQEHDLLRALILGTPLPPGISATRRRRLSALARRFVAGPPIPQSRLPPDIFVLDSEDALSRPSAPRQLLVPLPAQRHELMARAHILGHFGPKATVDRLRFEMRVFWPRMLEDVTLYVRSCATCLQFKSAPAPQHPARSMALMPGLFHTVSVDLVLGLPPSPPDAAEPYVGIFVITEFLTKFAVAYPIRSKNAAEIAPLLFRYISTFGAPQVILSDRGSEFVNKVVDTMCTGLGVERRVTSPYHPRSNGAVERTNAILVKLLEIYAHKSPKDWPQFLDYCLLAYRTKTHASHGFTPFELVFGRGYNPLSQSYLGTPPPETGGALALYQRTCEIRRLVEQDLVQARTALERSQASQRQRQDSVHATQIVPQALSIGDVVYTRNVNHIKRKLSGPPFLGPYKVHAVNTPPRVSSGPVFGNYQLISPQGKVLVRAFPLDQLRPLTNATAAERIWDQAVRTTSRSEILYDASKILEHRTAPNGRREYLVAWDGFTSEFNSWEPEYNLGPDLLEEYFETRKSRDQQPPAEQVTPPALMVISRSVTPAAPPFFYHGSRVPLFQ